MIEVEPVLGDDYPQLLRQIKTVIDLSIDDDISFAVYVGSFTSEVTSREQLKQIFSMDRIAVVFADEVGYEFP